MSDVIDSNRGTRDKPKLAEEVSNDVLEAILSISLPLVDRTTGLFWHFSSNGVYSIKFGYHVAIQSTLSNGQEKLESSFKPLERMWKVLWKMKA